MQQTNVYRALLELLPEAPLLIATVATVNADGTRTIAFPGGGSQQARGEATAGQRVFVRDGLIEGLAPALTPLTIDV
jgi:hypothetical protein